MKLSRDTERERGKKGKREREREGERERGLRGERERGREGERERGREGGRERCRTSIWSSISVRSGTVSVDIPFTAPPAPSNFSCTGVPHLSVQGYLTYQYGGTSHIRKVG